MNILTRVADRVVGRPLFLHPSKAELIASVLADRIGIEALIDPRALPAEFTEMLADKPAANRMVGEPVGHPRMPLYRRANGVGIIPIVGTLVNRGVAIGEDSSGFTSYESIGVQLAAAIADPQVASILLDIDSAGGEATGMFGITSAIRAARAVKPITALVNDMAASAAYGIAASATDVVVSPTSITGSIGVVMLHLDQSAEMQTKGRKATLIFAGAHKVDGHPFGPLSENVRADFQHEVDTFYARFVEQVSAGRPKLTGDAIRATEARIYIGSEAIDRGLADRSGTFDETLSRLSSAIKAKSQPGGFFMSNTNTDPIPRAEHDAAIIAARAEARAEGRTEGEAAGRIAAIDRVRAVLTSPEAKGREGQAMVFALDTEMAPEVAAKALAASPVAGARPALDVRGKDPLASAVPDNRPAVSWDRSLKRAGAKLPA